VNHVAQALAQARASGIERLDAQLLVAHVLQRPRAWVIAHEDTALSAPDASALHTLFARRAEGEPLAYLVGEREFHGLRLRVTPDVLVPRQDTETLVDWALQLMSTRQGPRVIDLGTGSGAIALAVKHSRPDADVHATDLSAAALAVARANADALRLNVVLHHGAWWDAVGAATFDLALANPPYVASGDPHLRTLRHEPATALTPAGDRGDGMADIECIVAGAAARVRAGGWLLLEHGADQASAVRKCLHAAGWDPAQTRGDLAGRDRVTAARRPSDRNE
jgi:release factor glutamine methyltransferase